jgi:hypothetical protein
MAIWNSMSIMGVGDGLMEFQRSGDCPGSEMFSKPKVLARRGHQECPKNLREFQRIDLMRKRRSQMGERWSNQDK